MPARTFKKESKKMSRRFKELLITNGSRDNAVKVLSYTNMVDIPGELLAEISAHTLVEILTKGDISKDESNLILQLPVVNTDTQSIYSICISNRFYRNADILLPLIRNLKKNRKFGSYWAKEILRKRIDISKSIQKKLLSMVINAEYECQAYDLLKYVPQILSTNDRSKCIRYIKDGDKSIRRFACTHLYTLTNNERKLLSL